MPIELLVCLLSKLSLSVSLCAQWDEAAGIYINKDWQSNSWVLNDHGAPTIAPTNFYPMIAGAPTDTQVERMLARWLTNKTEFAVNSAQRFGMPSVSRSCSAFGDNDYWRGRAW
jgi:putative isomerase